MKNKKLVGLVRTTRNGKAILIKSEYKTKKAFYNDLRANGYRVINIYTDSQWEMV